jgi:hypothetical protein
MPRFNMETTAVGGDAQHRAVGLATRRFPEIAVEEGPTPDGAEGIDRWLCRAPSASHVRRWAEAARLPLRSLAVVTNRTHEGAHHDEEA